MRKELFLTAFISFYALNAFAWGEMGHETIGEIAERNLTPETKTAITDILGPEKLALSSTWADAVRMDPDFDRFKSYHFIQTDAQTKKDSYLVLKKFPEILKDKDASRSVKIVALKYLLHVVGDIHQPFHVGSALDIGGNTCKVFWKEGQLTNLHAIWDGQIIGFDISQLRKNFPPYKEYTFMNYADEIIKNQKLTEEEFAATQNELFIKWAKESEDLRLEIYPGAAPHTYCQKDSTIFPLITEEYKKKASEITQKRILQSGLRLASFLNSIFKNGSNPGMNTTLTKEQVLNALDFNN